MSCRLLLEYGRKSEYTLISRDVSKLIEVSVMSYTNESGMSSSLFCPHSRAGSSSFPAGALTTYCWSEHPSWRWGLGLLPAASGYPSLRLIHGVKFVVKVGVVVEVEVVVVVVMGFMLVVVGLVSIRRTTKTNTTNTTTNHTLN